MSMDHEGEEAQTTYTFPAEYAVGPDELLSRTQRIDLPSPEPRGGRTRSVLIFAGAVLVTCVIGVCAWLAFDSAGPSADAASPGAASPAVTAAHTLTFRVTITSVGSDSFSGTVLANGDPVTIATTADTRFGTRARPLSRADLRVGETVLVRGTRTGTDTVTATVVA